jgi:YVTN family beta-propeller protein
MGFSPDRRTIAVVSIGSNSVTFIDTATNAVKHTTYLGRAPHEAFYTPGGSEVWVTVRGENYVSVIDAVTYAEKARIVVPSGPGMAIFSPDGKYGYVCSSFTPEVEIITVADHKIVAHVPQASPFCPNIAAAPDGKQVWFTLKDTGKVQVFDARPPFGMLRTISSGPITNHVNFVRNAHGSFAYVTVGGLDEVKVYRLKDFAQVATIHVGRLPHGIWPSGDGTRVYVGLENGDRLIAIDTLSNSVIATIPIGQGAQAVNYVPNAVPDGAGTMGLQPLGTAGAAVHLTLRPERSAAPGLQTSVTLFDQGITQVLQVAAAGLEPHSAYVLALSKRPDGGGPLEALSAFMTNASGAAVANAVGPIRQVVRTNVIGSRKYLVIAPGTPGRIGAPVQLEQP